MPKIYITYAITPKKELVVASYHEKVQSMLNAFTLVKKEGLKSGDLQKLEGDLPEQYDNNDVKNKLLELLTVVKKSGDFDKVTYRGDLNLCTHKKEDVALYLFDGTLNQFFSGKEVQLILESANSEYVTGAIEIADKMGLTGAILQTKSGVKEGALSKTYPHSDQNSNTSIPSPVPSALATSHVAIKDPLTLANTLGKVGVFNTTDAEPSTSVTEEEKVMVPKPSN